MEPHRGQAAAGHDLSITAIVCGVSRAECDGLTWPAGRTAPQETTSPPPGSSEINLAWRDLAVGICVWSRPWTSRLRCPHRAE